MAELVLTEEMRARLAERQHGCFLCRIILEQPLRKSGEFDVLAQVWHLRAEGVAEWTVACAQCAMGLTPLTASTSIDRTLCRECEAALKAREEEEERARRAARERPEKAPPQRRSRRLK